MRQLKHARPSELHEPLFAKPTDLLSKVEGIEFVQPARPDECCGFGGRFSVFDEVVFTKMGCDKVRDHAQAGAVKLEGDKASRMAVASAKFEAAEVLLPERASWLPDLETELFVFPGSRHDDQCDSISQALLDKNNSFMMWITPENWEVILAKSRMPLRKRAQL